MSIIENSRFTISRYVHKDNTSYYMINNRRVMFKDVSRKLNEFGIDLRYNRFLILQGEVEQISLMKPKSDNNNETGMLEYLEEIIGTSRYKEPLEQLMVKYEKFNEDRSRHMNRVNFSLKELRVVEKSKDETVKILKLENERKIEKSKLIQIEQHSLNKELEMILNDYNKYNDKLNRLIAEEEKAKQEKLELDEAENITITKYKDIKKESDELKKKFQELEKEDYYLNSKGKTTKNKLKKLKSQLVANQEEIDRLENTPCKNDKDAEKLEKKHAELEEELKNISKSIEIETENAQQVCSNLIQKRDEYTNQLMKFKDEQTQKLYTMNEAYNKFAIIKQKADSTKEKYDHLKSKIQQITQNNSDKLNLIQRYQDEIPKEKNKLEELYKKYQTFEQKRAKLSDGINEKNEELYRINEAMKNVQSRDLVKNSLLEQKRKGTLKGIFGRLGDLGAIDKKYDVAVTTACGRLRNFVVDTIDNAQKCVEYLKANNLPPTTFIALDKLRVQVRKSPGYPENVPRLFDLIRINDERVRPAFYFALGETLVAKDMDQATRITKNDRYRIVTLNGEMIEVSGAMSGGGKPKSGGMSQSIETDVSKDEIKNLEQEIESMKTQRDNIDFEINNIRENISQLEKDIRTIEENLHMNQLEINDYDDRVKQLKENLNKQKIEMDKIEKNSEMDKSKKDYDKAKSIYDKEMSKMDDIQEKINTLDNEIKEKFEKQLDPLKKKEKTLEKRSNEIQTELNRLLSDEKAHELNLKTAKETLANNQKNIEELNAELEEIVAKLAKITEDAKETNKNYEEKIAMFNDLEKDLGKMKKNTNAIVDKLKRIESEKLDLKNQVDERSEVVNKKKNMIEKCDDELESITLDNIDICEKIPNVPNSQATPALEGDVPMEIDSEPNQTSSIPRLTPDEIEKLNKESIKQRIKSISSELADAKPNYGAINDYRIKLDEHKQKLVTLSELTNQRDNYMEHLRKVKEMRSNEFKDGFRQIARKLKEMYRTITLGGDADLEYIDSMDPFTEGINFAVRPNKKTWKNNINLSGGEKTLASLALIFALHHYKPSPLYIMDEIDAALDFKNVSIIAHYIKERTRNTQFLIISLRNNMYELADRLIGIYKTYNITKSIPFDPVLFDEKLKKALAVK